MIRKLIASAALASSLSLIPMQDASATRPMVNPPPCSYEDGSRPDGTVAIRCFWDAKHRGNHTGRSYILTRWGSQVHQEYITHREAHRLTKIWRRNNR